MVCHWGGRINGRGACLLRLLGGGGAIGVQMCLGGKSGCGKVERDGHVGCAYRGMGWGEGGQLALIGMRWRLGLSILLRAD